VESLDVSGILFIVNEGDFSLFLNANRTAHLTIDGKEISRSSVFERGLNKAVTVFLSRGTHSFQLHFVPSRQGAYLHLFWRDRDMEELIPIPDSLLFSPDAAVLGAERITRFQSQIKGLVFIKNVVLFLCLISFLGLVAQLTKSVWKKEGKMNMVPTQKRGTSLRLRDIDLTKGLAGLPMIAVHLDGGHLFPFGVFGPALFFLCSGMNTVLFIERTRQKRNFNFYHLFFIFLLFFGGYTQIVIAHPGVSKFMPEFLQVSALSMLVIFLLSKTVKKSHQIGYLFPLPFLLHFLYQAELLPFIDRIPRVGVFFFGSAAFPLFPWCGFFLFGIFLLHLRGTRWLMAVTAVISGFLSLISVFILKVPVTKFDMSPSYVLFSLFVGTSVFLFFNILSSVSEQCGLKTLMAPLEVIGRNSLMFVYVHYFALAYIPLGNFTESAFLMLMIKSVILFLFCSFCVYYYERSKRDPALFLPFLLLSFSLVFLRYGGFLSVAGDLRLIDILIGLGFAFLYVQLRSEFRSLLKRRS